jgi:hypothetical protein
MRAFPLLAAALLALPLQAQEVQRIPGNAVAIYNLAGRVEVTSGTGSEVVVRITRRGADADQLRIETGPIRGRETLRVIYPSDEIVYSEMGRGSSSSTQVRADGTFSDGGGGRGERVRIRGSGSGMEAWADLAVEVPPGRSLAVYLATGHAEARGVEGDLLIDTGSGDVVASEITGSLEVDTGSGRIDVRGVAGDLTVDTGSGRVDASGVVGSAVSLDTGSGAITAVDIEADLLRVDTGSGQIELGSITSGDVVVDTGSGSVEVELLSDVERLSVDTGSGSVTVRVSADLGARVMIETGSGGIDLDFPVEVRSVRRNRLDGVIGDGRGEIEIDTGSGSVRLLRTAN